MNLRWTIAPLVAAGLLIDAPATGQCVSGPPPNWGAGTPTLPAFAPPDIASGAAGTGAATTATAGATTSTGSAGATTGARCAVGNRGVSGRPGALTGVAPIVADSLDHWTRWWHHNRDEFLYDEELSAVRPPARSAMTRAGSPRTSAPSMDDPRPSRGLVYTRVVPSLFTVLEQTDDTPLLQAATLALGTTLEPDYGTAAVDPLIELLRHDDERVAASAALALGMLGTDESPGLLLELTSCSSTGHALVGAEEVPRRVRAAAALGLGYGNAANGVDRLIHFVDNAPDSLRDTKACAIVALGLMDNDASGVAAAYLRDELRNEQLDGAIRSMIPTALGQLGDPAAIDVMLAVLEDEDTDRRVAQSCAIGIGRLAGMEREDVRDALVDVIEESHDAPLRHFAIVSLARIGARDPRADSNHEAHDELVTLLGHEVSRPRRSIDRPWAALAAGLYGHDRPEQRGPLVERVRAAYDDVRDPELKGAFALSLGLLGDRASGAQLRRDFERIDGDLFKGHAALALGLLGYGEANVDLRSAMEEDGNGAALRHDLAHALRLLQDPAAPDALRLQYDAADTTHDRLSLAAALGALGHKSGLTHLQANVTDQELDDLSRAAACGALGRMVEPTARPWSARVLIDHNYVAEVADLPRLIAMP